MPLNPKVYQFLVSIFASVGSILYGYDLGVIAGAIASPDFKSRFNPSTSESGAVVSVFTGGAFFGTAVAGPLGDILGRRLTIFTGAAIFYAGRVIAGLGVGFLVMIIPLYQAEIAHPSIRGSVTALQQFMLGIGALVASWTTYGCNRNFPDDSSRQWRVSLGIQIVPAGVLAMLIMLFPESPRWLIDHGKADEGFRTLAKLHAHGDEQDSWVQAEFNQIRDQISFEHENEAKSYVELFTNRSSFRRLLLATAIQASVQMTGVSAIQYYSPVIFSQIGISTDNTLKYQGISPPASRSSTELDVAGPMIGGNLANCLFFTIATIMLAVFPPGSTSNPSASWAFIVVTWLYNISFSATNGPLSYEFGCI
ncbi:hypothetical protein LTR49_022135 [Elasticomyces elasticus]|nr:hypothetical protein LTR49_022135 [Elasticomyces elasticus]